MKHNLGKIIVMSLGGSVMIPDGVDAAFFRNFRSFVKKWTEKKKFVIVTGGGKICRRYQQALKEIRKSSNEDNDWLGIRVTELNARFLQLVLKDIANSLIVSERGLLKKIKNLKYPVTIGCGWKPGSSTDLDTATLAKHFGAKEVVNIGTAPYVYDKDYNKYKDAKPFYSLSWKEYKKIIPAEWSAGAHYPIDPVAARFAEKNKLKMIVVGGDLRNVGNLFSGREFKGTIVG
jgi:uridylate kinase